MNYISVTVDGRPNEKQRSRYKYYIDVSDRWNDFGYRTFCRLYRIMENNNDIFIGYINCFNFSGEIRTVFYHPSTSSRCFISDYETAYRFILYIPKEDRMQLITELHICKVFQSETSKPIFTKSIMRGSDSDTFLKLNSNISNIIQTETDVNALLLKEKSGIESLFRKPNADY